MAALKTVYVELVAETRKLNEGFRKADSQIKGLTSGLKRLGVALGGVFAVRKFTQFLKGTILDSTELINTARAVGIATSEYERLAYVLETDLGASVGTTRQALRTLQQQLGSSSKQSRKFFKEAGLDVSQLRKLSPSDQALEVLSALSQIRDQSRRQYLAARLFGRAASGEILKIVNAGTEAIENAKKEFDKIGPSFISKEEEDRMKRAEGQMGRLKTIWERFKTRLVLEFVTPENLAKVDQLLDRILTILKTLDMEKVAWGTLAGVAVAAIGSIYAALGPVGLMLASIATLITTIMVNWEDLKRSFQWLADKMSALGFLRNFPIPFDALTAPAPVMIPMNAPSRSLPPPGSQTVINQDITIQGVSFEQAIAAARRIAETNQRMGVR
jgi:hypothetical protein